MGMKDRLKQKAAAEVEVEEEEEVETPKPAKKAKVEEKAAKKVAKPAKEEVEDEDDGVNLIEAACKIYEERNEEKITKTLMDECWRCILEALPEALFMNDAVKLGKLGTLVIDVQAAKSGTSKLTPKLSKEDIAKGKKPQAVETEWETPDRFVAKFRMSSAGKDYLAEMEESTGFTAAAYLASLAE